MKPQVPGITLGQHRPHNADADRLRLVILCAAGAGSWNGIDRTWTQLAWMTEDLAADAQAYDPTRCLLIAREDEERVRVTFKYGSDGAPHPFGVYLRSTPTDGVRTLA